MARRDAEGVPGESRCPFAGAFHLEPHKRPVRRVDDSAFNASQVDGLRGLHSRREIDTVVGTSRPLVGLIEWLVGSSRG